MRRLGFALASVVIAAVFYGLLSEALLFASHYIPPSGNAMPVVVLLGLLVSPTSIAGLLLALVTAWLVYRRLRRLLEPQLRALEPR
jgi:hypothetical protein